MKGCTSTFIIQMNEYRSSNFSLKIDAVSSHAVLHLALIRLDSPFNSTRRKQVIYAKL